MEDQGAKLATAYGLPTDAACIRVASWMTRLVIGSWDGFVEGGVITSA